MEGLQHENVSKLELDVTKDESIQAVVGTIIEKEEQIDVLVNNAAVNNHCTLSSISLYMRRY